MKFYKAKGLKFEKVELSYDLIKSLYVEDDSNLEDEEKAMNVALKNILNRIEERISNGEDATNELVKEVITTLCDEKEKKYEELKKDVENLELELVELRTLNPNNKGLYLF